MHNNRPPPRNNFNQNNNYNLPPKNANRPPPPSKHQLNNINNNSSTPSKEINSPFSYNEKDKHNINQPQEKKEEKSDDQDSDNTSEEDNYNKIKKYELKHKTSQKHKTPNCNYSINPDQIPRPYQRDEIFLNTEKMPIYETNISSPPPHPISFFSVKETQNSSPRFIRSTLNSVPLSQEILNESNLIFGLCVQPFAEIPDYEEKIPIVETGDNIFRCQKCKCYINNKYNITYSSENKQVAICNICKFENEFNLNQSGIKNDYFNTDYSSCPELVKPTIDFIAPKNFKTNKKFFPHYLFMLDITETSYNLGLPNYVLNSIQINLDSIPNVENSYIGFALYDIKKIYFFYVEKDDVRMIIMGDINEPFCPLSLKKLFLNINQQREQLEKLIEKITAFILDKNSQNSQNNSNINKEISSITGAAIKSGVDALLENGGRVMIFTPNPCYHGYGACTPREVYNKEKEPQKSNPFFPLHKNMEEVWLRAINNKIVVDQFIFMSTSYDISTMGLVSNLSGGQIEYYKYSKDISTINSMLEKLHFDLTRILTRPNYYDCKFMIRFSPGIDVVEILGPFNKYLGEAFQLGGCDPDYCYYYNMRLNKTFKPEEIVHIQLAVLYTDNYSNNYLRIFNTSLEMSNDVIKIFNNMEVNTVAKAMIYKEISLMFRTELNNVKKNLEDKIINSFKYYRNKEKKGTSSNQLILPIGIRYLPLYINSFLKTGILSNQNKPEMINYIIYLINKFLREPIYSTMKFLYPKFYRIDDIEYQQVDNAKKITINNIGVINDKYNIIQKPILLRLSKDVIDFDCAYLIDNGCYIYLFIFNQIEGNFYNLVFGKPSFDELKSQGISQLNEENNSELNQRLINIIKQLRKENGGYYQPVKIIFLEEGGIMNPILTDLLKEDKIDIYDNYPSYLCYIHNEILARMNE